MNETKTERGLQIVANVATVLSCLRGLTYATVIVGLPIIGCQALPLIERAVAVLENLDERVDRAFHAAAPVGREAVEKGVDALKSIDAKKVGEDINDAIRRKLRGKEKK